MIDGDVGAFSPSDEDTDGSYLVNWCGNSYTLKKTCLIQNL